MKAVAILLSVSALAESKSIVSFDGSKANLHWATVDDPVMGGRSKSTVSVADGQAKWAGEVKVVPFLHAPGFCTLRANADVPDITGSKGLKLRVKSPSSSGISKFSVQLETKEGKTASGRQISYSADFDISADGEFADYEVQWSDFKGTWRGQSVHGPPLKDQLSEINQLGLSTYASHKAATFELDLHSIDSIDAEVSDTADEQEAPDSAATSLALSVDTSTVDIVNFDGSKSGPSWKLVNDPVMGGLSHSDWSNEANGTALWKGEVKIVPKLKAPGFCNAETTNGWFGHFNDASSCTHLSLRLRSTIPYSGFKVSFAANTWNPQFKCFKADFNVSASGAWTTVSIPFDEFSNNWSSYTGEPIKKCSADKSVCPTKKNLRSIQQVGLWTEGAKGQFHLEVSKIFASGCTANPAPAPTPMRLLDGFWN